MVYVYIKAGESVQQVAVTAGMAATFAGEYLIVSDGPSISVAQFKADVVVGWEFCPPEAPAAEPEVA